MIKRSSIAAAALALCACAGPQTRPFVQGQPGLQLQSAASGPKAQPQRNLTHFSDGLRCMDDLMLRFGQRDVSVMIEEMQDQSRRLGAGTRDMMISAFADMTRRSRGVRLVTFGSDNQNIVQLLSIAQRLNDFKVVPQYDIRGSITQFDEDVARTQGSAGLNVLSTLFGVRASAVSQASVLGFDASVVSTADLSLVPGASSKNTVVVTRDERGIGDGQAQIRNGTLASFNFGVARNEGVAQSLRNMVELSTIELTGKLLRLPYWTCLNIATEHPEVQREIEDWYFSMQGSELTRFYQEQLRNRRFYDGPADGVPNAASNDAMAAYRLALGIGAQARPAIEAPAPAAATPASKPAFRLVRRDDARGEPRADARFDAKTAAARPPLAAPRDEPDNGLDLFKAFLLREIPKPPAKPFVAEKPAPGTAPGTPPAPKDVKLSVQLSKTRYKKGEPIEMTVSSSTGAYVYCYVQNPATSKIQRIFPNRFVRDPRIEADKPVVLPGAQGFKVAAGAQGEKQQAVGCLATEREIYNELPAQLRWGDFEDIRLASFEEIREAFSVAAKGGPVALEGGLIEVTER